MQQLIATRTAHRRPASALPAMAASLDLQELAHDARSMVTALGLYCDLFAEPGVLEPRHRHYLDELRLLSAASRRLLDKLAALAGSGTSVGMAPSAAAILSGDASSRVTPLPGTAPAVLLESLPSLPVADLAAELRGLRHLLEAMAGPGVSLRMRIEGGAAPVRLTGEDLTRVLVNLVKNASEAMSSGGAVQITLRERRQPEPHIVLTVDDSGPGIPEALREQVFASRFTTKSGPSGKPGSYGAGWSAAHHGLGLSITRSIVESAGGRITAAERPGGGARFAIELPVRRL